MLLTSTLVLSAAGYGAAAGALLPRAVYRFAVPRDRSRPEECPAGHALPGSWRGWVGRARCSRCERAAVNPVDVSAVNPADAYAAGPADVSAAEDDEPEGAPAQPVRAYGPRTGPLALAGALACAALALIAGPHPESAVWLAAAPFGLLLAAVDVRVRRLPDVLTLPLAAATAALLGLASISPGAQGSWVRALLGGAALAGGFFVLFLVHPRGLGFGDVKLALTPGVALGWYGWEALLAGAFLAFLLHAVFGFALIAAGRANRRTALPFGPFLLMGALLGMLAAGPGG